MIYYLIDFLSLNILHINLNTFVYKIHDISLKELFVVIILNYVLNETIIISIIIYIIYILNKILYRYLNKNIITIASTYTFYYIIINPHIDYSYFLSLIIVIILNIDKYNNNGGYHGTKKISYKSL